MLYDNVMIEIFLEDECKEELRNTFFSNELKNTETLKAINDLIKQHMEYVQKSKINNEIVPYEHSVNFMQDVQNILLNAPNEQDRLDATLYFLSWAYNTLLLTYNKVTNNHLEYINDDVIKFLKQLDKNNNGFVI